MQNLLQAVRSELENRTRLKLPLTDSERKIFEEIAALAQQIPNSPKQPLLLPKGAETTGDKELERSSANVSSAQWVGQRSRAVLEHGSSRRVGNDNGATQATVEQGSEVSTILAFVKDCAAAGMSLGQLGTVIGNTLAQVTGASSATVYFTTTSDTVVVESQTLRESLVSANKALSRCLREGIVNAYVAPDVYLAFIAEGVCSGAVHLVEPTFAPSFVSALLCVGSVFIRGVRLMEEVMWRSSKCEAVWDMARRFARDALDEEVLTQAVIDAAMRLTNSDRCSVFLVRGDVLQAHLGFGQRVEIPLTSGVAGHVVSTGEPAICNDVYLDPRFSTSVDRLTGYRTKTMLCVPVRVEGEVVGAAQLINKKPLLSHSGALVETFYTTRDLELCTAFANFVGASLRNCRINEALKKEQRKLEAILKTVSEVSKVDIRDVDAVLSRVAAGCRHLVRAENAVLYIVDPETRSLKPTSNDAEAVPLGEGVVGKVAVTGVAENIPNVGTDERFGVNLHEGSSAVYKPVESRLVVPIFNANAILGVVELRNKSFSGCSSPFGEQDMELLRSYTAFAAIFIANSRLLQFAISAGKEALELNESLRGESPNGRVATSMMDVFEAEMEAVLSILFPSSVQVLSADFNLLEVIDSFGSARRMDVAAAVLLRVFEESKLLPLVKYSSYSLLRFLLICRRLYRAVPYHSFLHAVDVTQTLATFILSGEAGAALQPLEQYTLLIAAVVHDIDHMGLNNSFHLRSDSPLGILCSSTGNSSVLEVHHCTVAVEIFSKGVNVFDGLPLVDQGKALRILVDAVLFTDMARHVELSNKFREAVQSGLQLASGSVRGLVLQVLLKAADISNVTKAFEISKHWAVAITEEFYAQGDEERLRKFDVAPMFDRTVRTALGESQIRFIDGVAAGFFDLVCTAFPSLAYLKQNMEANRKAWENQNGGDF